MAPEAKTIQHNAQRLSEILMGSNPLTAKPSAYKPCQQCGERPADSVAGILCAVCFRKSLFEAAPEEAKRHEWSVVVPERFMCACVADLPPKIAAAFQCENDVGIYLWGPPGVGKTYALCAAAKEFIKNGYRCNRTSYELLCLHLRDTFKPSSKQSEWDIIKPLVESDRLFIEDVGTTKSIDNAESDFSLRTLLVLLDIRMEHCRPTYITTNKSVENLAASFDARIGDRLRLYQIIKLEGESRRKRI